MYRLCVKYDEPRLEALADQKGYANTDEMCEDLALDREALLFHYVPLDITTEFINPGVYTQYWLDDVYAIIRVNEAEFEPFIKSTTVWKAGSDEVVWILEEKFLDAGDVIIPLQYV